MRSRCGLYCDQESLEVLRAGAAQGKCGCNKFLCSWRVLARTRGEANARRGARGRAGVLAAASLHMLR